MSRHVRPKPTHMMVCDLCNEEIVDDGIPANRGSLTYGWIAHPVTQQTKWAWLKWPTSEWLRTATWEERRKAENQERTYDFHTACIVKLVEANLYRPGVDA